MIGLRREQRVPLELPIRIWGMDSNKKPFLQPAKTHDVTRNGARVGGLNTTVMMGEIIGIQHGEVKSRCKVCWIGESDTTRAGQIGIRTLEPEKYLWGVALTNLTNKPDVMPNAPMAGRRIYERLACGGKLEMRKDGANNPLYGTLSDISITGCYAETLDPFPKGSHCSLVISPDNADFGIHARGEVRAVHPMVGMGVVFTELSVEDRCRLQDYVDTLKGVKKPAPAPAPPSVDANAPGPERPAIAIALDAAATALRELESAVTQRPKELDIRVQAAVRQTVEHARHTLNTAQQCVDLASQKCDQYSVMGQISAERIRMAQRLCDELVNDLDANEISIDTEGLEQLFMRTGKLLKRLSVIFSAMSSQA